MVRSVRLDAEEEALLEEYTLAHGVSRDEAIQQALRLLGKVSECQAFVAVEPSSEPRSDFLHWVDLRGHMEADAARGKFRGVFEHDVVVYLPPLTVMAAEGAEQGKPIRVYIATTLVSDDPFSHRWRLASDAISGHALHVRTALQPKTSGVSFPNPGEGIRGEGVQQSRSKTQATAAAQPLSLEEQYALAFAEDAGIEWDVTVGDGIE